MKHLKIAALLMLSTVLFGCVSSRSVIDVQTPQSPNGTGQKVTITAIDERRFETAPKQADTPSLKHAEEISDKKITERAIGRKRNSYGMAMGDVLLPEGKTVSQLIAKSVAEGYRKAGYQVVEAAEKNGETQAVTVHITEFWSWFSPGAFSIAVNNKARLNITSTGQPSPISLITDKRESMQLVVESDWKVITEEGLQAITEATVKELCAKGSCKK
ncbi:flagellar biosynthesis protein [Pseudomonas folii]|uniref:Flagellar biosynthesis protein n=1 Tax=Pseudomonas folii TaxID=2762593 RepID=A0ABR7AXB5_9PSED|nr:flagellar biosynthesis protein [Pseudomonas folii]MBC3949557.1 flagellar biosynthesis protein [Pseudomonas folii]